MRIYSARSTIMSIIASHLPNASALHSVFTEQLCILYNAKICLTDHLPQLVSQATFSNLKMALEEDFDDNKRQMVALKTIFEQMEESHLTHSCLAINAMIEEAHKHVFFDQKKHFESDMSILFYITVIENLQLGASELLNLMANKIAYRPYAQLVTECLDLTKENSGLFYCVAHEYLEN